MKKCLTILMFALFSSLAVHTSVASAQNESVIRFGVDASYPPFESKDASGKLVGLDIDLGNEICKRLHAQCVWVESDFDGMIPALKAKKIDGILSSFTATPQRAEQVAFSIKLFNTPARLVARKGSPLLPSVASLKGKTVGVEQGSTLETYAKTYWEPKGVTVVSYENQDLVYGDLISGRLDASLQDALEADSGFLKTSEGANFAFAGGAVNDAKILGSGAAIGLRKEDTALKARIDGAIKSMLKDGTYKKLEAKYFRFDIYGS